MYVIGQEALKTSINYINGHLDAVSLFRNKRVIIMLNEMTRRNTTKFVIFYIYENKKLLFLFFISCYFFPP